MRMKKQITALLFLALAIVLAGPGYMRAEENQENRHSLGEAMAPGTISLSMLLSDFEISWLYAEERGYEESFKIFRMGAGVGFFPVRYVLVEGLFRFCSSSLIGFEWSDLGIGISGFPPLGNKVFADLGAEWVWRNWSVDDYEYEYEPVNQHELGGHLGLGFLVTGRLSLGSQIYYKRILVESDNYDASDDQNWFGMRFRLLVFFPR